MSYECTRCGGEGRIPSFPHVEGGICFKCQGTGKQSHPPKKEDNSEVCDETHHLIKLDSKNQTVQHLQICIWKEQDKANADLIEYVWDGEYEEINHRCEIDITWVNLQQARTIWVKHHKDGFRVLPNREVNAFFECLDHYATFKQFSSLFSSDPVAA